MDAERPQPARISPELAASMACREIVEGLWEIAHIWKEGDERMVRLVMAHMGPETGGFEGIMLGEARAAIPRIVRRIQFVLCPALARGGDQHLVHLVLELLSDLRLEAYVPDVDGDRGMRWRQTWPRTGLASRVENLNIQLEAQAAVLRRKAMVDSAAAGPPENGESPTVSPVEPRRSESRFVREGQGWRIQYAGESVVIVRDDDGFRYIARLLRCPGESVAAHELYRERRSPGTRRAVNDDVALDSELEVSFESPHHVMDGATLESVREQVNQYSQEIEEAQDHDPTLVPLLVEERDALLEQLRQDATPTGAARTFETSRRRIRSSVGNAIRRALGALDEVAPEAARHLRASIRTPSGSTPAYAPSPPVEWVVDAE